ncbi:hypothetical protein N7476_011441 [Penicillium atrosanguineum]|uniref:Archaemetzincin-2 n=1 Tax=Penicillium atrosanguineum TaxID=1132637 RepID=A0A9W9U0J6_9EURO|nr:hypothetical protein N7476_011441 [Penicillium atrosanguineum]
MARSKSETCIHRSLSFTSSPHAEVAGFKGQSSRQLIAARRPSSLTGQPRFDLAADHSETFPAPLLLPGDDLAEDPNHPTQSFQEWLGEKTRNRLTPTRKTIYVIPPPEIGDEVGFMRSWVKPGSHAARDSRAQLPQPQDVCDYLEAFYHGVSVKLLPSSTFTFTSWEKEEVKISKTTCKPPKKRYVGLKCGTEVTRIRARPSPDEVFSGQVNLDDLLDAVIAMLPQDAFSVQLLMHHDMYEDEDDEFGCGRAYAGSRVCVVSSARYDPCLDEVEEIERLHSWPASHCEDYISQYCSVSEPRAKRPKTGKTKAGKPRSNIALNGPMKAALSVYKSLPMSDQSTSLLSALWLGRTCRTAAHELGHCFGMDHCVYYACSMQGTASIREDARQPPYLCPVDLAKVLHETKGTVEKRYQALLDFCERPGNKGTHFFAPFAAWLQARLQPANIVVDLT